MKQEKDQVKQTAAQVWKNNWFLIKLCMVASPGYVIFAVLDSVRNQISIFFEHTYGIGYVLEAAEFHYPFRQVAVFLLILAGCITLGMVFTAFVWDYMLEKERPKIRERIKIRFYEKAKELDLECYDNPKYYNQLVLVLAEVDNQIERCITFLQNTASGIAVFVSTTIYFFMKDKASIVFAAVSFVMAFVFNQMFNRLAFKIRIARNPHERKREYVKRVFYLSDYAKELRLNPEISGVLLERLEEANEEVYQVEKRNAKRRFFLSFMRRYVSNSFFSDVLYITYLVFQATVRKALSFSSVAILYNSFGRLKRGMSIFTDIYPFACETSLYVQKMQDFLGYEPRIVSEKNLLPAEGAKEIELQGGVLCLSQGGWEPPKEYFPAYQTGSEDCTGRLQRRRKDYAGQAFDAAVYVGEGRILADGVDIRDYEVEKYRKSIGTVFQDFKIFAGNVRENVLMNVAEQCEEEPIRLALSESGLLERIQEMKDGLDTQLTTEIIEKGVNLSGGESQKLAIARVFYQKAGLMILDEPSCALDPIAEYQLNHAMLKATRDKTVIFISHRLSTTRLADYIIMLEDGRIAEQGTHEGLLQMNGKYAQMWRAQAGAYIDVQAG